MASLFRTWLCIAPIHGLRVGVDVGVDVRGNPAGEIPLADTTLRAYFLHGGSAKRVFGEVRASFPKKPQNSAEPTNACKGKKEHECKDGCDMLVPLDKKKGEADTVEIGTTEADMKRQNVKNRRGTAVCTRADPKIGPGYYFTAYTAKTWKDAGATSSGSKSARGEFWLQKINPVDSPKMVPVGVVLKEPGKTPTMGLVITAKVFYGNWYDANENLRQACLTKFDGLFLLRETIGSVAPPALCTKLREKIDNSAKKDTPKEGCIPVSWLQFKYLVHEGCVNEMTLYDPSTFGQMVGFLSNGKKDAALKADEYFDLSDSKDAHIAVTDWKNWFSKFGPLE